MSQKTVALVANTSWNVYNFRMNIVRALQAKGYKVICIAPYDKYVDALRSEGVTCISVKMENRGVNPFRDLMLFFNLWKLFRTFKPAVALQFTIKPNLYGTVAATLCGIPVINNVSGLGTVFLNPKLSSKIAHVLYRLVFRYPFKVFFQNEEDLELFVRSGFVNPERCRVIPGSGVDLQRFQYRPYNKQTPFVFLMASRLIYDKGIREYLEACTLVKEVTGDRAEFWLQGAAADTAASGMTKETLASIVQQYPLRYFEFTDRIEEHVAKADVVVLPSYREGLSRLLLESAALGKPLIACDVPGCRQIVRNQVNGLTCKVKDAKDLSLAMIAIFQKTEQELQEFSRNSRKIVEEEFSENLVTKAYIAVVEEALGK